MPIIAPVPKYQHPSKFHTITSTRLVTIYVAIAQLMLEILSAHVRWATRLANMQLQMNARIPKHPNWQMVQKCMEYVISFLLVSYSFIALVELYNVRIQVF